MLTNDAFRPTWAEIGLEALAHNIKEVRRLIGKAKKCCAVVKADAYGHGVVEAAKVFMENGADYLAVATLSEALELRHHFLEMPILILGYTPNSQLIEVVDHHITQTIYNKEMGEVLSSYAQLLNKSVKVHIKVDTGMSRLGFQVNEKNMETILAISKLPSIEIEGIFTHFARADEADKGYTHQQFEEYQKIVQELEVKGLRIPIKHVANSATIIDLPEYHLDMVRAGIMLYGLYPSDQVKKENANLKPAMSLKTKLSNVKFVEKGQGISYGHIYHAEKKVVIGTLPLGYADGFTRLLSGKSFVGIRGVSYPLVGRICMDQCMVLLKDDWLEIGEEVHIFGNGSHGEPHIDEVANIIGTINYEIVCMVGRRVPRVYVRQTEIIGIKDYLKIKNR
ncbi:alanine racemase [Vallitalea okinawensis]|uniref:alanine racemase n=1 Tax=Vallitalea okinawensis TaxID=2078660 RepID=UPI000CFB601C|nr:alanine racemase [Vallitalea okinawensis]